MNTKQVQALLVYLGYEPGPVDGVMGQKTRAAVYDFQEAYGGLHVDGLPGVDTQWALKTAVSKDWKRPKEEAAVSPETGQDGDFWKEIQYFKREEFRCPCGKCGGFPVEPEEKLVRLAEKVRKHFGRPMTISSGVRCQAHNDELRGSVPNSRHVRGKAVDFTVSGFSTASVLDYVSHLNGIRYAYAIDGSYVHMDVE